MHKEVYRECSYSLLKDLPAHPGTLSKSRGGERTRREKQRSRGEWSLSQYLKATFYEWYSRDNEHNLSLNSALATSFFTTLFVISPGQAHSHLSHLRSTVLCVSGSALDPTTCQEQTTSPLLHKQPCSYRNRLSSSPSYQSFPLLSLAFQAHLAILSQNNTHGFHIPCCHAQARSRLLEMSADEIPDILHYRTRNGDIQSLKTFHLIFS